MSLDYDFSSHYEDRPIHRISVYSEKDSYILIGFDQKKTVYSVLQIKKSSSYLQNTVRLEEILIEDEQVKTEEQIADYLRSKNDQMKFVCKAWAILGFIKLLQGYYLMLVTDAEAIAKIGNHRIYKVNFVTYIPLFVFSSLNGTNNTEKKYLKILKSFDLTTGFYFSDTYDLTNTFQTNVVSMVNTANNSSFASNKSYRFDQCPPIASFNEFFLWNHYHLKEFESILRNKRWLTPFIYGYIEQIRIQKLLFSFQIVLISRRSRYHAGTRYLTRGLNNHGFVGNFVETEQIVIDLNKGSLGNPICSSFVQVRGSAPTYWFQETKVVTPKPPIHMNPSTDIYFDATRKHFADLFSLYGPTLFALNLVKKKEGTKREQYLTEHYQQAVDYLNLNLPDDVKIIYYHQDMKALLKKDKEEFLNVTNSFGLLCLSKIGFFCADISRENKRPKPLTFQTGVIRSNCVDCLDRTNTFQQLLGESALSLQVAKIHEHSAIDPNTETSLDDTVLRHFREMFGRMGDIISLQYGGSIAHKTNLGTQSRKQIEFLTSLKRYFSNTFTDQFKQSAINLFLGIHKPHLKESPIWETPAPIIWNPKLEFLNILNTKETWWKSPIDTFFSSINVYDDFEVLNKALSQPPVVKINVKNSYVESIQEDFDMNLFRSRRLSALGDFDSVRHDFKPERKYSPMQDISFDLTFEQGKNTGINFASDSEASSMAVFQLPLQTDFILEKKTSRITQKGNADSHKDTFLSDKSDGQEVKKKRIDARHYLVASNASDNDSYQFPISPQLRPRVLLEKKLTNFSKKMKKVYNQVLVIDEKEETEVDEERVGKEMRSSAKNRKRERNTSRMMHTSAFPEDYKLYRKYCTFFQKNTDEMFDDNEMRKEILEEMKLGFEFEELNKEFESYFELSQESVKEEEFPNKLIDYIHDDVEIDVLERFSRVKSQGTGNKMSRFDSNVKDFNDENLIQASHVYNLAMLKNILTNIYPNLQRPNITKA